MDSRTHRIWGALLIILVCVALCTAVLEPSTTPTIISAALFIIIAAKFWVFLEGVDTLSKPEHWGTRPNSEVTSSLPHATAVILAYLPNEQHIICATVRHFLMTIRCQALAEIILVYNSAEHLPVERELENLAQADSRLTLLKGAGGPEQGGKPQRSHGCNYDADRRLLRRGLSAKCRLF